MTHSEGLERMLERALDKRDEMEAENVRLLDQLKRTQVYEAGLLGDIERLKTILAARLSRIEELESFILYKEGILRSYVGVYEQKPKTVDELLSDWPKAREVK